MAQKSRLQIPCKRLPYVVAEAGFEPVPKPYIFAYIPPFQAFV